MINYAKSAKTTYSLVLNMNLLRSLGAYLLATVFISSLQLQTAHADSSLGSYQSLINAPTSTSLPSREQGGASVTDEIRPSLSYPSLRLDEQTQECEVTTPPPAPINIHNTIPLHGGSSDPVQKHVDEPESKPIDINRSDFELLVETSIGVALPVFGKELFEGDKNEFSAIDQVNVPSDFVVGPGDDINIRAWGSIEIDYKGKIKRDGTITLPKVGEISFNGLRFSDLNAHIKKAIGKHYRNFELSVTLGKLRSVRIYVTGFAKSPGTYSVNSLSSLVNALFVSGGASKSGDLRNIKLKRNQATIASFDLYKFLMEGDRSQDVRLQPEDVIYIPPLEGQVAISGSVNRSAIYHLKQGDSLASLIKYAGGLSTTAATQKIIIERISADSKRIVEEFDFSDETRNTFLRDGDLVIISPISPRFENSVTLKGHVAQPLRYKWKPNMRVSDLIPSTEALISPSYWMQHNKDRQIVDLLKQPNNQLLSPDLPEINWDYAVIERIKRDDVSIDIIPFNLANAVKLRDPNDDKYLSPGDTITVYALEDFRTPVDKMKKFITIEGEVNNAGVYSVGVDETLQDVIKKAGGVTRNAYLFATEFTRDETRKQQAKRINETIDRLERDYQRYLIDRSRNTISADQAQTIVPEAQAIYGLIQKLRAAEPTGRIILDLETSINKISYLPELRLVNKDALYIPPRPQTIEVVGAVFRQGSFIFDNRKNVSQYIDKAGFIDTADKKNVYVIRADGTFTEARRSMHLLPGDTLVVPEKVDRQRFVSRLKDWTQILYQFGLGAAGLAILDTI